MVKLKLTSLTLMFLLSAEIWAQTPEQEKFIELYKENYLAWISSPEIKRLQERDPELRSLIEQIPISETAAFREALERTKRTRAKKLDYADLLGERALDTSMEVIKQFLSSENTDLMINLYWDTIKSAETQEIVDLIIPHVEKAREEFERMGLEVAASARNLE